MLTFLCALNERFNVRQFATSKAARGYAAIRRRHAFKPHKHKHFTSRRSDQAYDALHASMSTVLAHFFANNPNFIKSKPEAIHQTRVAVRRMRAVLQAFKTVISYIDRKALNGELRWLQNKLGECRDWHVLGHDTCPRLAKFDAGAAAELRALARREHAARLPDAMDVYNSRRAQRLILNIQLWLSKLPHEGGPAVQTLRHRAMLRNLKRLRKLGRLTSTKATHKIHAIRILAKKMRYSLELFPRASDADVHKALAALTELQELLGDFNDASKCLELLSTSRESGFDIQTYDVVRRWARQQMTRKIGAARPHLNAVLRWGRNLA